MQNNNKLLSIFLIMLLFSSCRKKEGDGPTYTISGHIYKDCNMQPVANTYVDLLKGGSGYLANTTTDGTGYFKLEFKDNSVEDQKIRINGAGGYNEIMIDIPWRTSIDNLILFKFPSTNIKMYLNVSNNYTVNDTLFITNFNDINNKLKVSRPFTTGLLYSTNNFGLPIMQYPSNPIDIGYKINNGNYIIKTVNFTMCDTINITADIN